MSRATAWAGRLALGCALAAAGPAAGQPAPFVEGWRWGPDPGSDYGGTLSVGDIDADGRVEVFSTGGPFWNVLEYDGSGGFRTEYVSGLHPTRMGATLAVEVEPGRPWKLIVTSSTHDPDVPGRIDVYDGASYKLERTLTYPANSEYDLIGSASVFDADGDGDDEVVLVGLYVTVIDPTDWTVLWQFPLAEDLSESGNARRADFDGDGDTELLIGNRYIELLPEGDYRRSENIGAWAEVWVNLDGDPALEGIRRSWATGQNAAYDLALKRSVPGWSVPSDDSSWYHPTLVDVDGDGFDEYLFVENDGMTLRSYIRAYNVASGDPDLLDGQPTPSLTVPDVGYGVSSITGADLDGNGVLDLVVASGLGMSGLHHYVELDVFETGSFDRVARRAGRVGGSIFAVTRGDADGDGSDEVLALTDSGHLHAFDAATGALEWSADERAWGYSESPTGNIPHISGHLRSVAVGDVDGDGQPEVVVGADRLYTGALFVFDGAGALEATHFLEDGVVANALVLADLDGDGAEEIYVGGDNYTSAGDTAPVYVVDGRDGSVRWRHDVGCGLYSAQQVLRLGDVTGDGRPELVSLCKVMDNTPPATVLAPWPPSVVRVLDPATGQASTYKRHSVVGLDLLDVTGDGTSEVVMGTAFGEVVAIDGGLREVLRWEVVPYSLDNYNAGGGFVRGVRALPGPDPMLVALLDSALVVLDPVARTEVWRSPPLSRPAWFGKDNAIFVRVDRDGRAHLSVATEHLALSFSDPATPPTAAEPGSVPPRATVGLPSPNPSSGPVAIVVELPAASEVRVDLYDLLGRLVSSSSAPYPAGVHRVPAGVPLGTVGVVVARVGVRDPDGGWVYEDRKVTVLR